MPGLPLGTFGPTLLPRAVVLVQCGRDAVRAGGLQVQIIPRALPPLSARNGQHGHDLDRIARENGKMRMPVE